MKTTVTSTRQNMHDLVTMSVVAVFVKVEAVLEYQTTFVIHSDYDCPSSQ